MKLEQPLANLAKQKSSEVLLTDELSPIETQAIAAFLKQELPLEAGEAEHIARHLSKASAIDLLKTINLGSGDQILVVEKSNGKQNRVRKTSREAQNVARYLLNNNPLSGGGMGTIFRGFDLKLNRRVAMKRLSPKLASDTKYLEQLRKEAQVHGRHDSAGVVSVSDLIELPDGPTIIMRFIDPETSPNMEEVFHNKSTGEVLEGKTVFSPEQIIRFVSDITPGLQMMHRHNNFHLDLKPGNFLMSPNGAMITDFGLASEVIDPKVSFGTPRYIAPERVLSERPPDASTDLFSLTLVLYRMMTGRNLLKGDAPMHLANDSIALSQEMSPNTKSRLETDQILEKYCQKYKLDQSKVINFLRRALSEQGTLRYKSISEYLVALKEALKQ